MPEETDSWFKNAFGIDLGKAVDKIKDDVSAAASSVAQVVGKAAGAVNDPAVAAGSGSFPLGDSVGRGGKNAASDVRAVQAALGIPADGDCGPQTIAAIEAYQRKLGHPSPTAGSTPAARPSAHSPPLGRLLQPRNPGPPRRGVPPASARTSRSRPDPTTKAARRRRRISARSENARSTACATCLPTRISLAAWARQQLTTAAPATDEIATRGT